MTRWIDPEPVEVSHAFLQAVGGNKTVAETLLRRGIGTIEEAEAFLDPTKYSPASPYDLPDMARAVDRLRRALEKGERICVWGDFDVDGQTATTLLVTCLRKLGADPIYHIPNRQNEGHGVHRLTLTKLLEQPIEVLLTCDTGIAAHEAVELAASRGVETIITDHHHLPPALPDAYAILNPKLLPDGHPLYELPGVGVAYKLAEALLADKDTSDLLDLVALGIVADVAIQRADTRYLLQRGLAQLRNTERLGLRVMMELAEIQPETINEQSIAFSLAPRLNALGRLADANPIVELLTTKDMEQARILANQLEGLNNQRKLMSEQIFQGAMAQIEQDQTLLNSSVLVLNHAEWHTGIIGIVANRLVEVFHRPVILVATPPGEIGRASARSIPEVDITAAISANADLLIGYGGHAMAAGLQIEPEKIADFRRALSRTLREKVSAQAQGGIREINAFVPLSDLSVQWVDEIEKLAPFGAGNPPLILAAQDLQLQAKTSIGRKSEHLKLLVEDPTGKLHQVLWWQSRESDLPARKFDLAYSARTSTYKGARQLQIEWIEARPAAIETAEITKGRTIQFVDYRHEENPLALLDQLLKADPTILIWREASQIEGFSRHQLVPAQRLLVWTIPPGPTEWDSAIKRTAPEEIILLGIDPHLDTPETFLKRLAGLVKYALHTHNGSISLTELSAASAQRIQTTYDGLLWLAAKGHIVIVEVNNDEVLLTTEGSHINPTAAEHLMQVIQSRLEETSAYRAYWKKANHRNYSIE